MKLKQTEYCHNCNKYVEFEFEDVTEKQVIYCPDCGHEHYREIDSGTIINIRARGMNKVRIAMPVDLSMAIDMDSNGSETIDIIHNEYNVIGEDEHGNAIVEGETMAGIKMKKVSSRRWGQDQRQNQA